MSTQHVLWRNKKKYVCFFAEKYLKSDEEPGQAPFSVASALCLHCIRILRVNKAILISG